MRQALCRNSHFDAIRFGHVEGIIDTIVRTFLRSHNVTHVIRAHSCLSIVVPGISLSIFTEDYAGTLALFLWCVGGLLVRRSVRWEPSFLLLVGLSLQNRI